MWSSLAEGWTCQRADLCNCCGRNIDFDFEIDEYQTFVVKFRHVKCYHHWLVERHSCIRRNRFALTSFFFCYRRCITGSFSFYRQLLEPLSVASVSPYCRFAVLLIVTVILLVGQINDDDDDDDQQHRSTRSSNGWKLNFSFAATIGRLLLTHIAVTANNAIFKNIFHNKKNKILRRNRRDKLWAWKLRSNFSPLSDQRSPNLVNM